MYENLVRFVSDLPDDALGSVPLEDMALCAAWYDSYREDADIQEQHADLRQTLDRWVRLAVPSDLDTEGVRQEPLLRDLLKELGAGRLPRLGRDELDFLY